MSFASSYFPQQKKSHKIKFLLPVTLCLLLGAALIFFPKIPDENQKFRALADELFINEMLGNTLNMHYTLAHPENYGITEYTAVLPCYASGSEEDSARALETHLQQLSEIDSTKLSPDNLYTYGLLYRSLEQSLAGCGFSYYDDPLSPASGMQSQLPILLAEYTFRSKRDVEDYLVLLDHTDEYFASLALYEQDKKNAGLLQSDSTLAQIMEQCETILSAEELDKGTHFLQTTFSERLTPLLTGGLITSREAEHYISLNNRLLSTVMQPAYIDLADTLTLLMGDGSSLPTGLASFPGGQEYYAYLLQKNTGSSRSVEELKELLYPTFEAEYEALQTLLKAYPEAISAWVSMNEDSTFPYTGAEEILADLTANMAEDFPLLPMVSAVDSQDSSGSLPLPAVKTVSQSLAPYCAPAFYLTPPLDDVMSNVIYINPLSTTGGLELYTTLAHEGYPGHLYQSVYSNSLMAQKDTHPIRQLLWYGGYQEGWALYVEFISYDYAVSLAKERGQTDLAHAIEIEKHNRSMQLCLYSLLDVSIHYDNASYEQIHKVLSYFGVKDPATTREVYDYIAEEPTNYLKYYLGYLEILSLKAKAMNLWQSDYSDYRFHQFFLDCGPSDFDTLERTLS